MFAADWRNNTKALLSFFFWRVGVGGGSINVTDEEREGALKHLR